MKKILSVLLAVVIMSVLVGCGTKPSKVTVWCWDPNFNGYSMKEAAKVYNTIHPDVTIEIVDIPQDIAGKIQAAERPLSMRHKMSVSSNPLLLLN